ncbi:MAG: alanine dehydrogenase, partial [Bacteroidetes bacterium]|nr:alanine dehydrogenase [Bacteroidota bacterium]
TYFFFSHTVKKQEYNRGLLQAIMQKNITLIDYEMLVDENEHRLIGFGRWAGIVGAHYALLMLGKRRKIYNLKPAVQCINKQEMLDQYHNLQIPPVKLVITGGGRVAQGAIEVMEHAEIHRVTKEEYLNETFDKPVFVQLHSKDLYHLPHKKKVDKHHFYHHPQEYENSFMPYIPHTDVLINCMFWSPLAPRLFEVADIENPDFNTKIIADISCDIDGSVPITFKATSIADPIYGVNIHDKRMGIPYQKNTIDVMAVGNLPNELPRDASKDFGKILMETFIPILLNGDKSTLLDRATITKNGKLTERYAYLEEFAEGG